MDERKKGFNMHAFVPPFAAHCTDNFIGSIAVQLTRSALPAKCKYNELAAEINHLFNECKSATHEHDHDHGHESHERVEIEIPAVIETHEGRNRRNRRREESDEE